MPSTLRVRPRIRQAHSSRSKTRWAAAGNQSRPTNGGVPSGPGIGSNLANRQRVFRLIKPHLSAAGKLDLPTRTPPRLFDQSRPHALGPQLGNLVLQLIAWELKPLAKDSHRPDEPPLRTQAGSAKINHPRPASTDSNPGGSLKNLRSAFRSLLQLARCAPKIVALPAFLLEQQALRACSQLAWQPRVSMPGGIGSQSTRSASAGRCCTI